MAQQGNPRAAEPFVASQEIARGAGVRRPWPFVALALLSVTGGAMAQDVMQVGADTHTLLFENARVRVLAAHVPPGGKVPMHSHPANVIYFSGDATLRITLPDGSSRTLPIKAATAVSNGPLVHAIENVGATEFSEIQVELKDAAQ